jgi:hypothetical protein
MSGVLSFVREIIGLYGWHQAQSLAVFWACARIAFIVSAAMLYQVQNKKIVQLEREVEEEKDKRGRPMPMVACKDFNINGYSLFVLSNTSDEPAMHVQIADVKCAGKTLTFMPVPALRKDHPPVSPEYYVVEDPITKTVAIDLRTQFFMLGREGNNAKSEPLPFSATFTNYDSKDRKRMWRLSCNFTFDYQLRRMELGPQSIDEVTE